MPKFAVNIGSRFKPFSYEELALPLILATTAYNELLDKYGDLTNLSEIYRLRALKEKDSPWAQHFLEYADALLLGADELTRTGYSLNNRNLFSKLKGLYSTTVVPITKGMEREELWAKTISTLDKSKRPVVGKMPSLQLFIDNPMAGPNIINGTAVEEDAAQMAKALSSRMYSDALTASGHAAFVRTIQKNGMSPENINAFMSSLEGQDLINSVLSKYDMSGMSPELIQRLQMEAISGAFKGFVYSETVNYAQDPLAIAAAKDSSDGNGGSGDEKNPWKGILTEDLLSEEDEKSAYERKNRFLSFTEGGTYNQAIRQTFINKVGEILKKTSNLAALAKEDKQEAIEEVAKLTKDKQLATLIIETLLSKNNWQKAAAVLDRYYFLDMIKNLGIVNDPDWSDVAETLLAANTNGLYKSNLSKQLLPSDTINELLSIYDAVTNTGKLRVHVLQLKNKNAADRFFGNAIKIQGLDEIAKDPNANYKYNRETGYSMSIKGESQKQYADYVLQQLDGGATLHGVTWDSKNREWKKTGKEYGMKDLISEKSDTIKFRPLSITFARTGNSGKLNAIMKCQIGKEIVKVELPYSSNLISSNIQNAVENAYTLADLVDPKKSALAIKNLSLLKFANTFGEDSAEYQVIKAIKELGHLTPELVEALNAVYKAYIATAKDRIQDLGTPGLE